MILSIVVITILSFIIFKNYKTDNSIDDIKNNQLIEKYIVEYSSGTISKNSDIYIRFTDNIVSNLNKNYDINKIIDISPDVKGSVNWIDKYTLEFTPAKPFESGAEYEITFNLEKLSDKAKDLPEFTTKINIIKQNFELKINEQITIDKKELKYQKVKGQLMLADVEDINNVKNVLSATQNDNNLKIKFNPSDNNRTFLFEIDSIKRLKSQSEVILKANGKSINVETDKTEIIKIPSINDFSILKVESFTYPEQYIKIHFTDPLFVNQDLRGIVKIKDSYSDSKYEIEDNILKLYPANKIKGNATVQIEESVKNILGKLLNKKSEFVVTFEELKPSVRFVNEGIILPSSDKGLLLPFEAVNLKAVDVRITKIYKDNIMQFLQVNDLGGNYQIERVGNVVVKKTVRLDNTNVVDFSKWNRFTLNLNDLIKVDKGAIYRVEINFTKNYSTFICEDSKPNKQIEQTSNWYYFDDYYYGEDEDNYWEHRDDPCYDAYYGASKKISQNILATDIGVIVKKGNNNSYNVYVNNILTTNTVKNADVEFYNYQQQIINKSVTDNNGIVNIQNLENVSFIIVKHDNQYNYVKVNSGNSLSLSRFNVSGESLKKGLKGFIYGERGVWRPGDSLFIAFMLQESDKNTIAEGMPIIATLYNANYKPVKKIVKHKNEKDLYVFKFKTQPDDNTGLWSVSIDVGGNIFTKNLKVETIKPNRLKIKLSFDKEAANGKTPLNSNLYVEWLHGAIGKNLKALIEADFAKLPVKFKKFKDYTFEDATKKFYPETSTIFEGKTDETGNANFKTFFDVGEQAPGKLKAIINTKVFEPGGNFSINQTSIPYFPYDSYVGVKIVGREKNSMLLTDTNNFAEIVIVDNQGKIIKSSHPLEIKMYKLEWRWWWEDSDDYLANYIGRSYVNPVKSAIVYTENGKSNWKFRINYPDWGRYLIRIYDKISGNSTSKIIYLDWPDYYSRENTNHASGATMISFTADKEKYNVGETVNLTIPTPNKGKALITIENGSQVLSSEWLDISDNETHYSFKVTKEMTPNIYVGLSLLQPHAQTTNDLPIRLYGVLPLSIEDEETHLYPVINMPDKLEAEKEVTIKVSEKNDKDMYFTLAVVDEGLLDITNFKTPEPWYVFYAKEALGVVTWDIYDYVIGAFSGEIERLLNIGGGDSEAGSKGKKANRFKPVVKYFGPLYVKGGKEKVIKFTMPKYIGAVKTMVVAKYKKAYGSTDKVSKVTKPLMILGTLPRTLSPTETVDLPVSIFAMEKNIKKVNVSVSTNNLLSIDGKKSQRINFDKPDEKTIYFKLKTGTKTGVAKVKITAISGSNKATYDIELDVKNPNSEATDVISGLVESKSTWNTPFKPIGIKGTNKVTLEVSSIPPLNLEKRLNYLVRYPYGCIEQTTSSAFPQLFLDKLMDLNKNQKDQIEENVKNSIKRIMAFQISNGGLGYWPGSSNVSEWGTNYAGHFLIEAKNKGYTVSNNFMDKWKKYQNLKAKKWINDGPSSQLIQAYRLYTLALNNTPNISAMNRLKQTKKLSTIAKWRLAAAYALINKTRIANKLVLNLSANTKSYVGMYYTYGSQTRDKAMILETLTLLNKKKQAYTILKEISEKLSSDSWLSTQTISYSLIAMSGYIGKNITTANLNFEYSINGKSIKINTHKPIVKIDIPVKSLDEQSFELKNNSTGILFAKLALTGIPDIGNETSSANNINLYVQYVGIDGNPINPVNLQQGTDFAVIVSVQNPTNKYYRNVALSQVFASGWEILNSRIFDEQASNLNYDTPDYSDIRDDRIYSFFDLGPGKVKNFKFYLNASYKGTYYLPSVNCELMYNGDINARIKGNWVNIIGE